MLSSRLPPYCWVSRAHQSATAASTASTTTAAMEPVRRRAIRMTRCTRAAPEARSLRNTSGRGLVLVTGPGVRSGTALRSAGQRARTQCGNEFGADVRGEHSISVGEQDQHVTGLIAVGI